MKTPFFIRLTREEVRRCRSSRL